MSYQAIDQLAQDAIFGGRQRAACTEQAQQLANDQRPAWVAVSTACLKGDGTITNAFTRLSAAGPGIADKAATPDGGVDQSKVTDADLLSLTQANWPVVAGLYFTEDGSPIP